MVSCGPANDFFENGGAAILGEVVINRAIRYYEGSGASEEQIQNVNDLADKIIPNRRARAKAWEEATPIEKGRIVVREGLIVASQTESFADRQEQLQYYINVLDSVADGINAISQTSDATDRKRIAADKVFSMINMYDEYANSNEKIQRKFDKMCRENPSLAEEYEVAEVDFIYEKEYDDDGEWHGKYNKVPVKWAIRKKFGDNTTETFISEDDLKEEELRYWESLKNDANDSYDDDEPMELVLPSKELANTDDINSELEARTQTIAKINDFSVDCYEFDKTELNNKQKSKLLTIVSLLENYTDLSICLTGHTCNIGTDKINHNKGLKRAEAVKMFLEEQGVSADRISVESAGSATPLVPNNSFENRKVNRRVTFLVK